MPTLREEVHAVVRELPGIIASQISDYVNRPLQSGLSSLLADMYQAGELVRDEVPNPNRKPGSRGRKNAYAYRINDGGHAIPERKRRKPRTRKLQAPTPVAIDYRLAQADARILELEQWKADALLRYPDLATPPLVLKAREILAKVYEEKGDSGSAAAVRGGRHDNAPAVKGIIAALNQ